MLNLETLKNELELLNRKADVFASIDRVRYDELINDIKIMENKITKLMILEAEMERFEAFIS